jgi:N utilization substance protein B
MRSSKDPRHIARVIAVMDLYNFYFLKENKDFEALDTSDLELGTFSTKIRELISEGVKSKTEEIDAIINKYSDPIKTTDLDLVLLQVIRSAIYEGFIAKTIPPKVSIDEAIEVTRDFGMETSTKKVSGILGKVFDAIGKEISSTKTDAK